MHVTICAVLMINKRPAISKSLCDRNRNCERFLTMWDHSASIHIQLKNLTSHICAVMHATGLSVHSTLMQAFNIQHDLHAIQNLQYKQQKF